MKHNMNNLDNMITVSSLLHIWRTRVLNQDSLYLLLQSLMHLRCKTEYLEILHLQPMASMDSMHIRITTQGGQFRPLVILNYFLSASP